MNAVGCMNAVGYFVPPMLIFPRIRMNADLIRDAPAGTIGRATPTGYIR